MKWWKVKYKLQDFWYWLKWFIKSRGGGRLVGRHIQMPLFEIASNPKINQKIKLSVIKNRRYCPDGCLYVFEDENLDAETKEKN